MSATARNVTADDAQEAWMLPDAAGFPAWATERYAAALRNISKAAGAGAADGLYPQQAFVRAYLAHDSPYRGLVLYHGLGSGKTCSAIAVAEACRARGARVLVMVPASLRRNYLGEVRKCGAREFREAQAWRPQAQGEGEGEAWEPAVEGDGGPPGTPFAQLPPAAQAAVRRQVDGAVARVHRVVAYNAAPSVTALMREPRPFDDTVVVIDEVHNFIGRAANGRQLLQVYEALMDAERCRVVLLSGTPLVNQPEELAYLINLAHGPVHLHEFVVRAGPGLGDARVAQAVRACPHVHEAFEAGHTPRGEPRVAVRFLPPGFVRAARPGFIQRAEEVVDHAAAVACVRDALGKGASMPTRRALQLLTTQSDLFRGAFLAADGSQAQNTELLQARMLGLVSFFPGHDASLYPTVRSLTLRRSPMSARQFSEYTVQRGLEMRRERAAKRHAAAAAAQGRGVGGDDAASYRPFSRLVCNFAFPPSVPRPTRRAVREGAGAGRDADRARPDKADEADEADEADPGQGGALAHAYVAALEHAIDAVETMPGSLALGPGQGAGLAELSPKFAAIVQDLQRLKRGTAIVYSQFRRVEGVNLLASALRANGFEQLVLTRHAPGGRHHRSRGSKAAAQHLQLQLQVRRGVSSQAPAQPFQHSGSTGGNRGTSSSSSSSSSSTPPRFMIYSNDDPDIASVCLSLFNNRGAQDIAEGAVVPAPPMPAGWANARGELVRVLLITASGAEGITTRNVRRVHLLEPFWHANRVEQVIGRAVRAESHTDLPPADRNVEVVVHMASFTPDQAESALAKRDAGLTSDEYVHSVAQRKRRVLLGLLDAMRAAAVDCRLHPRANADAKAVRCWAPPQGVEPATPVWRAETLDTAVQNAAARGRGLNVDATRLRRVRLADGRTAFQDPATGALYDEVALLQRRQLVQLAPINLSARASRPRRGSATPTLPAAAPPKRTPPSSARGSRRA